MIVLNRHNLKTNHPGLIKYIQEKHEMGPEIYEELYVKHVPVVGLCHTRGYFIIFGEYFAQCVMDHIITNVERQEIGRRIDEVILYESYIEYETERVKAMSKVNPSSQTGINYN